VSSSQSQPSEVGCERVQTPGFLFSRKGTKGYAIRWSLALGRGKKGARASPLCRGKNVRLSLGGTNAVYPIRPEKGPPISFSAKKKGG